MACVGMTDNGTTACSLKDLRMHACVAKHSLGARLGLSARMADKHSACLHHCQQVVSWPRRLFCFLYAGSTVLYIAPLQSHLCWCS